MTANGDASAQPAEGIGSASVSFQDNRSVLRVAERIPWRISLLTLVLAKCYGQRCRVGTLNLLMWAMQNDATRSMLISWWGGAPADLATVRSDPRLLVTIDIALAEGLVSTNKSGTIRLTDRGREFAALIDADVALMLPEKNLLRALAPLSETEVARRLGGVLDA